MSRSEWPTVVAGVVVGALMVGVGALVVDPAWTYRSMVAGGISGLVISWSVVASGDAAALRDQLTTWRQEHHPVVVAPAVGVGSGIVSTLTQAIFEDGPVAETTHTGTQGATMLAVSVGVFTGLYLLRWMVGVMWEETEYASDPN